MLRRVISLVAGLLAVLFSGAAWASFAPGFSAYSGLWAAGSGSYVHASAVAACQTMGGDHVGAWWKTPDGPFNACLNSSETYLGQVWQSNSSACPQSSELRVLDSQEKVSAAGSIADVAGGHYVCAPVGVAVGTSAVVSMPLWGDVQNGVTQYLKGFSFSGAAQSAGLSSGQSAYEAAVSAGKTAEQSLQAGTDAAYLAAVTYTKDNETSSIMSRAILSGVAAAGVVAALPAFLVGGSLAAAASLAVATVAAGGVAIDAIQATTSGPAVASSASSTPVNVRLSDSSPSLSGVAQLKLVESYFVPDVSLSSLGSAAFTEQSDGTLKSTSAAGVTTLSADKTTVTTQSGSVTTKVQATTATVNNVPQQVVVKTVTAPVQTDAGEATASVSTVYDKTGVKLTGDVVALTDAVSNGVRSSVTADNSLSTGSGGSGSSIASQFPSSSIASGTTTGAGGSFGGAGASGTFCGGAGQEPCAMDLLTPTAPFQVAQTAKDSNSQFWGSLETSGKDKLTNIATSGDQNGLLTWAMIPLPATGSCADPVLSFAGHTIALSGFCDRMSMIRLALEYFLYLTTVFYVFKLASESSTTV